MGIKRAAFEFSDIKALHMLFKLILKIKPSFTLIFFVYRDIAPKNVICDHLLIFRWLIAEEIAFVR